MLAGESKPFHVVCDTSDFAIGCALMQFDDDGRDYQSRQLKSAERNYPVHDKELLAMRYALVKFGVYLFGEQTRMARWLSFFSKYNFVVHHKPGKNNILADALSRRPRDGFGRQTSDAEDEDLCAMCVTSELNLTSVVPTMSLRDEIAPAYDVCRLIHLRAPSEETLEALPRCIRSHIERYRLDGSLLTYSIDRFDNLRMVVPNDEDLRARIIREYHDAPTSGHLGREKTFAAVARDFFWPHLYKWVRKWVRTCETCQCVKPSPSSQAPLRPLPVPTEVWRSVSMDFVFGLQPDVNRRTGVLVFVDRFSKMVHLIPVTSTVTAEGSAAHFVDSVFRLRRLPDSIVSEHDPRFTSEVWTELFKLLGTKLTMSTAAHPETDGQTKHVNRVKMCFAATRRRSELEFLPAPKQVCAEQRRALVDGPDPLLRELRATPAGRPTGKQSSTLGGGGAATEDVPRPSTGGNKCKCSDPIPSEEGFCCTSECSDAARGLGRAHFDRSRWHPADHPRPVVSATYAPKYTASPGDRAAVSEFVQQRQAIMGFVRDTQQAAVDKQKENADKHGRNNKNSFCTGDRVFLSTEGIRSSAETNLGVNKLAPCFIVPFKIVMVLSYAYTLDIPTSLRLHPTFYVGRLKRYRPAEIPRSDHQEHALGAPPDVPVAPSIRLIQGPAPGAANRSASFHRRVSQNSADASATPGSTVEAPSPLAPHATCIRLLAQPPPERPRSGSRQPQHRPLPANRTLYHREGPPPIADSAGNTRWIVRCIMDHQDPHGTRHRVRDRSTTTRVVPPTRHYHVRWLGFPSEDDTWEPRSERLHDVLDVVRDYETALAQASVSAAQPTVSESENETVNAKTDDDELENANAILASTRVDVARHD
ncbi:LOW QUALITY PROTEIN: reverse transcriptase [Phytophthora megakarya]|uniref:Reverse transcriptase n=1 Tax=Phytophthora megakarya TaxID=4795 RepID=A0A225V365_9STRA|nr:LOW QUALITY PROTEIN: reverse transcriptase [Phytophthora megakarya]